MTLTAGDIHYLIKTLYRLDLTTVHVNALRWVIKLTSCWKQTQTCVVLKYRLGCHEKQPVFRSEDASPSLWRDHFLQQEILWHASRFTEGNIYFTVRLSLPFVSHCLSPFGCRFIYFHHVYIGLPRKLWVTEGQWYYGMLHHCL